MSESESDQPASVFPMEAFCRLARAGDLSGMRAMVAQGFDLKALDSLGGTLLGRLIYELAETKRSERLRIIKEVIAMGADADQKSEEGNGPLYLATVYADCDLIRTLIEAGADPNTDRMDTRVESLYDQAEFDYRCDTWDLNYPEDPVDSDLETEEAWLGYLDRMAIQYGKPRPEHLRLLRELGARKMNELNEDPSSCFFQSIDDLRNKLEVQLEVSITEDREKQGIRHIELATDLLADGQEIEGLQTVDVLALIESTQRSGRFEIFTCGCNRPCPEGARFHGVKVSHRHGLLTKWELHVPQYIYPENEPLDESFFKPEDKTFWFSRAQVLRALNDYRLKLQETLEEYAEIPIHWSPEDQSAQEVLQRLKQALQPTGIQSHAHQTNS